MLGDLLLNSENIINAVWLLVSGKAIPSSKQCGSEQFRPGFSQQHPVDSRAATSTAKIALRVLVAHKKNRKESS